MHIRHNPGTRTRPSTNVSNLRKRVAMCLDAALPTPNEHTPRAGLLAASAVFLHVLAHLDLCLKCTSCVCVCMCACFPEVKLSRAEAAFVISFCFLSMFVYPLYKIVSLD